VQTKPLWTYHRFVKTTPKPRATKNNNGELVGLELESAVRPLLVEPGEGTVLVDDIFRERGHNCRTGVDNAVSIT
jgi:hypothetical protein